jgi:general secretion pathway protein A
MLREQLDFDDSTSQGIYLDFYHFQEAPFNITPDPCFLFLSRTHHSVLEKLLYAIHNRAGFVLLTGEVGTGKTTICRSLLDSLDGKAETVYIINPSLSGIEIISTILDDLGVTYPSGAGKKELMDRLNAFLLTADRLKPVVILIDDAQTMPMEALEDLRLLSNLETDKEKLLQMLLVGQPELLDTIAKKEMRQLRQRVAVYCTLDYLKREEVAGYVERRLFVAGNKGQVRFTRAAINIIFRASSGIPRLINKLCDYTLIAGYLANDYTIQKRYVIQALNELGDLNAPVKITHTRKPIQRAVFAVALAAVAVLALFIGLWIYGHKEKPGNPSSADVPALAPELKEPAKVEPKVAIAEPVPDKLLTASAVVIDPGLINKPAALEEQQQKETGEQEPPVTSFTALIGSCRTVEQAIQTVSKYKASGIESHWVKLNLGEDGIWYRIFSGRFGSKAEVLEFIRQRDLSSTTILEAPWGIQMGEGMSIEAISQIKELLKNNQYDGYVEEISNGSYRLLIGAFVTKDGAEHAARKINFPGIFPTVVLR